MFADDKSSQNQKAGADSVQIQAAGDIVVGITEDRAREIALSTSMRVLDQFTSDANDLIQERILKLDDRVIAALVRENRLQVFADPGFQRTYRKAQEGAASTERDADYDLLAALLQDRAERGSNRPIRAGIELSIEVIDRIDDEALRGLTVMQAAVQYSPKSGEIAAGISLMSKFFEQLLDGPLPTGVDWLEHLDLLDGARINPVESLRTFQDYWPSAHLSGYMSAGIEVADAPQNWFIADIPITWIAVPHDLKPGFVRLNAPSKAAYEKLYEKVSPVFRDPMLAEADSVFRLSEVDETCRASLMDIVRGYPVLRDIEQWWDQIPKAANITAVGKVLARANAERLDVKHVLPPLN